MPDKKVDLTDVLGKIKLPPKVINNVQAMAQRYEARLARQIDSINRLLDDKRRLERLVAERDETIIGLKQDIERLKGVSGYGSPSPGYGEPPSMRPRPYG